MTPESPSPSLDLLVVGGLTVDRFVDGTAVPGGSVLHAALAAHAAGRRVGVVSVVGPEPEAATGVEQLAALPWAAISRADRSIVFAHDEADGRRDLVLVDRGHAITAVPAVAARAVLYAPVAGEVGAALLAQRPPGAVAAAILQGWLRTLLPGVPVAPILAAAMPADVIAALRGFDLLVASREDLAADGDDPPAQLDALRGALGAGPAFVLTDGAAGAWLDLGGRWHEPVPRAVEGGTVGAGDMLAALLAVGWPRSAGPDVVRPLMADAMRAVADRLAARR
jgi:sugar/nucleoside kinase (ribokinase family)